ncbi:MAG: glycoside hydrolase family 16 protein [Candidatus Eisenbacteria bacterium]|uniref:Glycoside hydrolase family 16 protein n=1 Tax=Eiseniibacteriota bacterium TaxID=2212470 RepID=A0A956SFG6_UNCEI|nr:glycoside hydrolase family 16 protein [Candidatus Eisenbacteria bacterium]
MMVLSSATACSDDETITWELSWSDDFEGAEGSLPDPANWRFDVGEDWGNAQLEYDTDRATNVSLDGTGNLRITAREESYQGRSYTSGRINSLELFDQAYGRFEARVRLPIGAGVWPAFWLLGANFLEVGWPDCGEIDVMEYRGQEPFLLHGSLHGPGYSGGSAVTSRYESGTSLDSDFHVYAIEWTPESISWYFDDALYQIVTPRDLPSGGRWVFDHPFFVILNVAVGGHFVGPPNDQTIFPQTMLVDYVRVYREKSG